jgi:hypothetical protein
MPTLHLAKAFRTLEGCPKNGSNLHYCYRAGRICLVRGCWHRSGRRKTCECDEQDTVVEQIYGTCNPKSLLLKLIMATPAGAGIEIPPIPMIAFESYLVANSQH